MYKLCLGFLFSAVLAISPCLASDDDSDNLITCASEATLVFAEAHNRLPKLYDQGAYEQLLQEAVSPEEFPFFSAMPLQLQEQLLFLHDRHVGMACYKLAVKNSTDDELVEGLTNDARRCLQHYLDWVKINANPKTSPLALVYVAQLHSAQVYGDLGVINSQLFTGKILEATCLDEAKSGIELFTVSVLSLENAYKLYKATARRLPNYDQNLRGNLECIFAALEKAIPVLKVCQASYKPALKEEINSLNKKILEPLDKSMASQIRALLKEANQSKDEPKKAHEFKKLGARTRELASQNEANRHLVSISNTSKQIIANANMEAVKDPIAQRSAIQVLIFGLCGDCLRFQSQTEQLASLEGRLYEMEKLMSLYFGLGTKIMAIYQHLHGCFDEKEYCLALPVLTTILTRIGKIDAAIERLEALMEVQKRAYGQASPFLRILYAHNKQLVGDSGPWLEYEQEKAAQITSKTAAKKKKKAEQRLAKVEALKELQAIKEEEKASQPAPLPTPVEVMRVHEDDKGKEEAVFVPSEDFVPESQRKAEKLARHAAKQEERDRKAAVAAQLPQMIPVLDRPVQAAVVEEVIPEISLVKAYGLTSRAKAVDEEIENGTWRFTREQFKTYLKAMGCEYRSGRGVHEKLLLPKQMNLDVQNQAFDFSSTHVMKNGKVLTVFIDIGGSLTLPLWDKDYVPDYMRKQITSARNELKKLAYRAQEELKDKQ